MHVCAAERLWTSFDMVMPCWKSKLTHKKEMIRGGEVWQEWTASCYFCDYWRLGQFILASRVICTVIVYTVEEEGESVPVQKGTEDADTGLFF